MWNMRPTNVCIGNQNLKSTTIGSTWFCSKKKYKKSINRFSQTTPLNWLLNGSKNLAEVVQWNIILSRYCSIHPRTRYFWLFLISKLRVEIKDNGEGSLLRISVKNRFYIQCQKKVLVSCLFSYYSFVGNLLTISSVCYVCGLYLKIIKNVLNESGI